jgi:zinc protease
MAWIQDQATRSTGPDALAVFEDVNDLDVWTDSGLQLTTARLEVPLESLDAGLGLLREVVVEPDFQRKDLDMLRRNQLRWWLVEGPTRADSLISSALAYTWFPPDHPFGARPDVQGWRKTRLRHLRARHRAVLASAPVDVMVVADLPWEALEPRLEDLLRGLGVDAPLPDPPEFTPPARTAVIGIDLRGTDQVSLAMRTAAPVLSDPDSVAFRLIDVAVGGTFLSRLNRSLREERGLTYGIGSDYVLTDDRGHWTITTEFAADDVTEALDAIEGIVAGVAAEGLTQGELDDAVAGRISAWNATLSTVSTTAQTYGARLRNRKDGAWARARLAELGRVSRSESAQVSDRWLGPRAPRLWVVVGDRERLAPQLSERGWEVDWIPAELVVLGRL